MPKFSVMLSEGVLHNPSPGLPSVGYSIVAEWWPTTYHLVITLLFDSASSDRPLAVLLRELRNSSPHEDDEPIRDYYETRVFKCDRDGNRKFSEYLWFKKQYADFEQARVGHEEVVQLLMKGKLRLMKQRLYPEM
jgi:hypothetical protein